MKIERQGATLRIGERTSLARINYVLHFRALQIKRLGNRDLGLSGRVNFQIADFVSPGIPVVVDWVIGGGVEIRDNGERVLLRDREPHAHRLRPLRNFHGQDILHAKRSLPRPR